MRYSRVKRNAAACLLWNVDGRSISRSVMAYFIIFHATWDTGFPVYAVYKHADMVERQAERRSVNSILNFKIVYIFM